MEEKRARQENDQQEKAPEAIGIMERAREGRRRLRARGSGQIGWDRKDGDENPARQNRDKKRPTMSLHGNMTGEDRPGNDAPKRERFLHAEVLEDRHEARGHREEPDESQPSKGKVSYKRATFIADEQERNEREDTGREHRPGKQGSAAIRQGEGHQKADQPPEHDPLERKGSTDCRIHGGSGGGPRRHGRPF